MYCARCARPLLPDAFREGGFSHCACGSTVHAWAFPAQFRGQILGSQPSARAEADASCYYHPANRAEVPCASCGRLLCNVCDIEVAGTHRCASCIEGSVARGEVEHATELFMHDSANLVLALWPLVLGIFLWPLIPFTALYTLYRVVRYFKAPLGPVPRTRVRHWVAGGVALFQLLSTALAVAWLVTSAFAKAAP